MIRPICLNQHTDHSLSKLIHVQVHMLLSTVIDYATLVPATSALPLPSTGARSVNLWIDQCNGLK